MLNNYDQIVCIHQPAFAPWLGLVECMFAAHHFVFYDDVQFEKGGIQNRNKIKTSKGVDWISIPVAVRVNTPLNMVKIASNYSPLSIIKTLQSSYGRAPYFKYVITELENILCAYAPGDLLCDLNIEMLQWLSQKLNSTCKFIRSSELGTVDSTRIGRIGEICAKLKANYLYTGTGMLDYCTAEDILNIGVTPIFHNYQLRHVVYDQRFPDNGFIPCLSILDYLFNVGCLDVSKELYVSAKITLDKAVITPSTM